MPFQEHKVALVGTFDEHLPGSRLGQLMCCVWNTVGYDYAYHYDASQGAWWYMLDLSHSGYFAVVADLPLTTQTLDALTRLRHQEPTMTVILATDRVDADDKVAHSILQTLTGAEQPEARPIVDYVIQGEVSDADYVQLTALLVPSPGASSE
ncbi:hypothetical protein M1555_01880 [Patescibacteria group bacterium]|nr:hypothetical protein [Patescibacteria group bacterium]